MSLITELIDELNRIAEHVDVAQVERMRDTLLCAKRIYTVGRGRSGLISRMFAMRLMHLGLCSYAVDEVVTPAIQTGDVLLVCSGSGETASLKTMADKAKKLGAQILLITANEQSYLCAQAEQNILIPGYTPKNEKNTYKSLQPMGSQFEQLLMLTLDALVLLLKNSLNISEQEMMARHANLE